MFSTKHAYIGMFGFLNCLSSAAETQSQRRKKNTEGKLICMVITWLLTPRLCSLPVASLSDGHRQKGHEPGCGVGKLIQSFYHQGLFLSGDVLSGLACSESSFPTLTLAVKRWPQGEVYNVNYFEDGCCCVKMFAVHSLPDSNGNPVRASSHSLALVQNTYQSCVSIRHITTLFSPWQNNKRQY